MDYRVQLDVFHGPLDLLLYLVKRSELDLRDIHISRITNQYLEYLNVIQMIDVENAGEFVVMAGTLIELKSKVVLPQREQILGKATTTPEVEEEDDPRRELVRQLLEHKRFKDASALMDEQATLQNQRHARRAPPPPTERGPTQFRQVELWDLVSAFGRLLRETLSEESQQIVADQTPIHVHMEMIEERLKVEGRLAFSSLFTPPRTRGRLVGIFLALLQLTREHRAFAEQGQQFNEIYLSPHQNPQ